VLHHLAAGRSNQEIAERLGIALATVKLHVNAILAGLNVRNRTEAAIIAHRAGLRDDDAGEIPDGAGA
jgi:DNA-binding NarL/FixJ family response regulator